MKTFFVTFALSASTLVFTQSIGGGSIVGSSITTTFASSPGGPSYTTSVVKATVEVTITDCPETVTDCPARTKPVITTTVSEYTTVCPVTTAVETETPCDEPTSIATLGAKSSSDSYGTSIVYATSLITVISCAETVTDCPARTKTSSFPLYTTVYPIVASLGSSFSTFQNTSNAAASTALQSVVVSPISPPASSGAVETVPSTNVVATSSGAMILLQAVSSGAVETGGPVISGFLSATAEVASSTGNLVATQTGSGLVEFTGAANANQVGSLGAAAAWAVALFALF